VGVLRQREVEMSNVTVALTTTRHIVDQEESDADIVRQNIPICVAAMSVGLIGDVEHMEMATSQALLGSCKVVHVDSGRRSIFIGEDPDQPESGILEYTEERPDNQMAADFFTRWDVTHQMVLEFQVWNYSIEERKSTDIRFALMGYWAADRWLYLRENTKSKFGIMIP